MPKIMKSMNRISRCQAMFRGKNLEAVCPCHHAFVFSICRSPGHSQEQLARELCLNKSTVARTLSQLEDAGLVRRDPNPEDKRQSLVYPTDKMLEILPEVKALAENWNALISEGVSIDDMEIFEKVLVKLESNALRAIGGEE